VLHAGEQKRKRRKKPGFFGHHNPAATSSLESWRPYGFTFFPLLLLNLLLMHHSLNDIRLLAFFLLHYCIISTCSVVIDLPANRVLREGSNRD